MPHRLHFLTQYLDHPTPLNVATLVMIGVVVLGACYLVSRVNLTLIVVVGMFLQLFSGNWGNMGVPIPLDRVVLAVALTVLVLKGARAVSERRIVLRPLHLILLSAAAWATASALVAGTLFTQLGLFALLDRFGLVPFAFFCVAPYVFGTAKGRNMLLILLVAVGLYLSVTACLEGAKVYSLIFPRYISNPNLGIQFGRARGPFLESTGDGFCIFCGAAGAAVALGTWRSWWARGICYLTMALTLPAVFFTLTRGVWIGAFLGAVVGFSMVKRTRRWVIPMLLTGVLIVVAGLAISPTLRGEAVSSADRQASVWDRQNTDLAALRIIEEYPLSGVGWENFINVSASWIRQQPTYPITGLGLEVHNVFLSHAAELGLPGLMLWGLGLLGGIRRALFRTRQRRPRSAGPEADDEDLQWWEAWRPALVAILICFFVEADLAPFSEPLPNALLWTWLGVMAIPYTSTLRLRWAQRRAVAPVVPTETAPGTLQPVSL